MGVGGVTVFIYVCVWMSTCNNTLGVVTVQFVCLLRQNLTVSPSLAWNSGFVHQDGVELTEIHCLFLPNSSSKGEHHPVWLGEQFVGV